MAHANKMAQDARRRAVELTDALNMEAERTEEVIKRWMEDLKRVGEVCTSLSLSLARSRARALSLRKRACPSLSLSRLLALSLYLSQKKGVCVVVVCVFASTYLGV